MYKTNTEANIRNGFSQKNTKHNNFMLIFDLIRKYSPISRIRLAKMTGLSATTVSMIVEEMKHNGIVVETGCVDTKTSGRKPISLSLNAQGGYICVLEIINTGINYYLYDLLCECVDVYRYRPQGEFNHLSVEIIESLLAKNNIDKDRLLGINVDYPGIVDKNNGKMIFSAVVSCDEYFNNLDVEALKKNFPESTVLVHNDSDIAAYSAFMYKTHTSNETFLFVNIFECIGAGVIYVDEYGDRMLNYSVEIGHIMVDSNASHCMCGNIGCLELVAGAREIFRRINEETDLSFEYSNEFLSETNVNCMKMLGHELKKGNAQVYTVMEDIAEKIAIALANVNNILDPGEIHIGGLVKYLGEEFIDMIREKYAVMNVLPTACSGEIKLTKMDRTDCSKGAANMVLDAVFAITN